MDVLRRHLFWITTGVVLIIVVGWYFLYGVPMAEEARSAEQQTKAGKNSLEAAGKKELPTKGEIEAADRYRKDLKRQAAALLELWPQGLNYTPLFRNAPSKEEPLRFDNWKEKRKEEILKKAKDAGLKLPANFAREKLYEAESVTAAVRDEWLKNIFLVGEIVDVLCGGKPDSKKVFLHTCRFCSADTETSGRVGVGGAVELERLDFIGAERMERLAGEARNKAYAAAAGKRSGALVHRGRTAKKPPFAPSPYSVTGVEVVFVAPFAAVPHLVKMLESNRAYFAEIRRFDMERAVKPYPDTEALKLEAPARVYKDWKPSKGWTTNSHYREGPVRVKVLMALYEFEAGKAKALLNYKPDHKK